MIIVFTLAMAVFVWMLILHFRAKAKSPAAINTSAKREPVDDAHVSVRYSKLMANLLNAGFVIDELKELSVVLHRSSNGWTDKLIIKRPGNGKLLIQTNKSRRHVETVPIKWVFPDSPDQDVVSKMIIEFFTQETNRLPPLG